MAGATTCEHCRHDAPSSAKGAAAHAEPPLEVAPGRSSVVCPRCGTVAEEAVLVSDADGRAFAERQASASRQQTRRPRSWGTPLPPGRHNVPPDTAKATVGLRMQRSTARSLVPY